MLRSVAGVFGALGVSAGTALGDGIEWRTIDGAGNNQLPGCFDWGSSGIQLQRMSGACYEDGFSAPVTDRPNARAVSNAVFAQNGLTYDTRGLTDFVWQWGQFLDHDMDLTTPSSGESFNITVPAGDTVFTPGTEIPLTRSAYDPSTGATDARQQVNEITAWIDASNVYGSDASRAAWLRESDPSKPGQLKVSSHSTGDLLPYNDGTVENDGGTRTDFFVAGDIRANEQTGLTAMHTLFVREHNRLAEAFAAADPNLTSDEIYERARRVVGAEMQAVTYNEFLPALLGSEAPGAYTGYDASVDPSIMNEFSAALYRVGHTMISNNIKRLDASGNPIAEGDLGVFEAFFDPTRLTDEGGIDPVLRGLSSQVMQKIDATVIDDLRNMLFGPPGAGGLDLVSLNIQRGRDHGLASYNEVRAAFGLTQATSFDQITSDTSLAAQLRSVYGQTAGLDNVHLLDVWVGALAEDHMPGSSVGELLARGLSRQFNDLRIGDRFYYQNDAELVAILGELGLSVGDLETRLLSDIIMDNTGITGLRANVFMIPAPGALGVFGLACVAGVRRRRRG